MYGNAEKQIFEILPQTWTNASFGFVDANPHSVDM